MSSMEHEKGKAGSSTKWEVGIRW